MPTLRRPATSHQRSATLQQFQYPDDMPGDAPPVPKYSLEQHARPRASTVQADVTPASQDSLRWTSFFHARRAKLIGRGSSDRSAENSPGNYSLPSKRIHLRPGSAPRAYLVTASMLSTNSRAAEVAATTHAEEPVELNTTPKSSDKTTESPEDTPTRRARRSISMHFSGPSNWISRTSGSIRRPKRGAESKSGGKRNVSAPLPSTSQDAGQDNVKAAMEEIFTPPESVQDTKLEAPAGFPLRARKRNSSSPLPPLSRLSSFNVDLNRLGNTSTPGSPGLQRPNQTQISSMVASQVYSTLPHSRGVSNERASTLASSDMEVPGLASGDDDDTDFKSDTMFDSIRTVGSHRVRTVETPLESMFDESPPSTAGNGKTKRLSIQEILGRSWDGDTKIMEEDEGSSTPHRGTRSSHGAALAAEDDMDIDADFPEMALPSREFGRLSIETDDDDWARDEEDGLSNGLSPPSSSVNSRRGVSPQLRSALANISGNGSPDSQNLDTSNERPRSNIFDWAESTTDKFDTDGHSPRPKTVHGKQELDLRGGRPPNRKGPTGGHVRSQSVPVVPDIEPTKATPKFGTWGLGTKTASEDWDDDFDFDEGSANDVGGKEPLKSLSMIVPPSIQATQPTVKAHSGQIRELSLLVSSLKRLCRQGRDLDLIDGQAAALWKEAENIIALASPDEEEEDEETDGDQSSLDFDPSAIDERFLDEGFEASALENVDDPFSAQEHNIPKTAVVKERQVVRRRSVFSPDDDIFGGNWPLVDENTRPEPPRTPDRTRNFHTPDGTVVAVIEAMEQQRASSDHIRASPVKPSNAKLFFDTNSLQELVKRASSLFHTLSDLVRKEELLTQSPAVTPKHERLRRHDGSPAFTRVFTDPSSSPPKRLPKSHSTNTVMPRSSIDSPASNAMNQRMQMMTVS